MEYDIDEEGFEKFWYWVNERQRIYRKRFIEDEDPPWTEDEYLQERHFCNVYRRLDKQSQYYIENIANRGTPEDVFLSTALFRIFNKGETWDLIGLQRVEDFDAEEVIDTINKAKEAGHKPFNSAYMITGAAYSYTKDKTRKYVEGMGEGEIVEKIGHYWSDHFVDMGDELYCGLSPEELTEIWTEIPGISDFIGYEIYCDLCYNDWFPFDENDYVNMGPGANRGINWIDGRLNRTDKEQKEDEDLKEWRDRVINSQPRHDPIEFMEWLRDIQDDHLADDFFKPEGKDMTLRTVEHSLCEADKYRRLKWNDEHDVSQRMKRFEETTDDMEEFASGESFNTQTNEGFSSF